MYKVLFVILLSLSAHLRSAESVVLRWTAPGDDGKSGRASLYDLRYSTSMITESNWGSATQVTGLARPLPYGNRESVVIGGLLPATNYFFAIKTADELFNWSKLSNVVQRTTCAGCIGVTGNVNGSVDNRVDILDLSTLISYLTSGSGVQVCSGEANIDSSIDGVISLVDLSYLVSYLSGGGATLPQCR